MNSIGPESKAVGQISVDPQPGGAVGVYLVEVTEDRDARAIRDLLEDLKPHIEKTQLSRGRLVSYVVQALDGDPSVLSEIEQVLKHNYQFVVIQRSFDQVIYRIVKELCADTGSKLLPIPHCNICGRPEPFPDTVVTLSDGSGDKLASRCYCSTCTASLVARTNKDYVLSLLSADRRDFGDIARSELVRSRGRTSRLRYKVKTGV